MTWKTDSKVKVKVTDSLNSNNFYWKHFLQKWEGVSIENIKVDLEMTWKANLKVKVKVIVCRLFESQQLLLETF